MNTEDMRKIIESAQVGDVLLVKSAGGRPTRYKVRKIGGKKARQLSLDGRRGAMRVLVDGGDQVWIREASARASDGSAHRRVQSLRNCTTTLNEKRAPDEPRSCGMIMREKAIREAGLPSGYDIELNPRGFQPMAGSEPAGTVHASAYVAVCECWKHWAMRADRQAELAVLDAAVLPSGYDVKILDAEIVRYVAVLDELKQPVASPATRVHAVEAVVDAWTHAHEQLAATLGRHRTTAIDRDVAKADASRCRRALQQIREISKAIEPSGKELPSGELPEQVVANVAHRLLVAASSRTVNISNVPFVVDADQELARWAVAK
jgi:hypothetical protein